MTHLQSITPDPFRTFRFSRDLIDCNQPVSIWVGEWCAVVKRGADRPAWQRPGALIEAHRQVGADRHEYHYWEVVSCETPVTGDIVLTVNAAEAVDT